jgi:hypothetical protein
LANYRNDCCSPRPEHHKKEGFPVTILNCGNGTGVTLPVGNNLLNGASDAVAGSWGYPTLVVGTVTLDTRELAHPDVKIDFSSLVNFRADSDLSGFTFRVVFQLSRSCDHGPRIPLANWLYQKEISVSLGGITIPDIGLIDIDLEFKDPFSFVWCDCHDCAGCCTYLVEIIDIYTFNVESASITNVGITALASGQPRHR